MTFQIFDRKYFDGWSQSLTKRCIALKFDGLNFDGLAGSVKNVNISPRQNFPLYGTMQYIWTQVWSQHKHIISWNFMS